jgi:hypothetical protein
MVIDVLFIIDIFIQLLTTHRIPDCAEEKYEHRIKYIIKHNIKMEIFLNLIASIPALVTIELNTQV